MDFRKGLFTTLRLIIYYAFLTVFLCAALATVYMIYTLCVNLVAGQSPSFNAELFVQGIYIFLPLVLIFQAMFMTFYLIRHPTQSVLPLIVYVLIYVSSWLFLIPGAAKANAAVSADSPIQEISDKPSAGYFRKSGSQIFYYSSIKENGSANGLCVDTQKAGNNVYTFSNLQLSKKRTTFTDSLIQSTIEMPDSLSIIINYVTELSVILTKCAGRTKGYWLCFATLALPLLGVIAFRNFSQWRLVNIVAILIVTFGSIAFNIAGYMSPTVVTAEKAVNTALGKLPLIKNLAPLGNPCVILSNILFFLILLGAFFIFEAQSSRFTVADSHENDNEFGEDINL